MDPSAIPVAEYEEDPEESFEGPVGLTEFFNGDDEEDYYEDDGVAYEEAQPLERSAAQRGNPLEVPQAETGSGHTHCQLRIGGAVRHLLRWLPKVAWSEALLHRVSLRKRYMSVPSCVPHILLYTHHVHL